MAVMDKTRPAGLARPQWIGLRVAGSGLLAATGAIHLDLYLTGYRTIPTIGWLFLMQVIAAFGLALAVAVTGSRLAAAAGAGFALSTLGGYLLSVWIGLFGFREVRTTAGIVAGIIEVAAFAVLALLAALPTQSAAGGLPGHDPGRAGVLDRVRRGSVPGTGPVIAGVSVLALVLLGIAVSGAGAATQPASAGGRVTTVRIAGVSVLANAKGHTLYWFAPDTPAASHCTGSCATYWPPVKGPVSAGQGVTGKLGIIRRPDGTTQASYNGHPLYTYIGDSHRGQASGNNLNLNGGLWHEVTVSG
jgi:predicted lipoprotein with Yx(FWY)xxD motif